MIVCIGPICIPVYALFPFLVAILRQIWEKLTMWWRKGNEDEVNVNKVLFNEESVVHMIETDEDLKKYQELVQKQNTVMFVKWTGNFCGPCKEIAPKVKLLAQKYSQCVFCEVSVDNSDMDDWQSVCNVSALPTFIAFNSQGQEIGRLMGGNGIEEFVHKHAPQPF